MIDSPFSPDYVAARQRFRDAADRLGWVRHAHPIDTRGPAGEELTIDVTMSSAGGPEPVLVVSSGVHGVEGFFGSAVQLAALREWERTGPPAGVRVVFLHAVSPYGFAHRRRFNEDNVDPNRNFLLDGQAFAGSPPLYDRLDPLLNPRRPPSRWDVFLPKALVTIARHGFAPLKQAIAQGQYEYPHGLFFGGRGPSQSQLILREHTPDWLGESRSVVHLDLHTGLGPWASYKLLIDPPLAADQHDRAARWFGAGTLQRTSTAGISYHVRGGFGPWCAARNPDRDYLFLCAEFGTYGNLTMIAGVRAENQAHLWGRPDAPSARRAKERLKELFVPASPDWRRRVVEQSLRLIRQAVAGIAVGA